MISPDFDARKLDDVRNMRRVADATEAAIPDGSKPMGLSEGEDYEDAKVEAIEVERACFGYALKLIADGGVDAQAVARLALGSLAD